MRQLDAAGGPTGLEGEAALAVSDDAVLLTPRGEARVLVLRLVELAGMSGVHDRDGGVAGGLCLHPLAGPAVALHPVRDGDAAPFLGLVERLERGAFALPELTRALRGLGTRPVGLEEGHDRWFGALLAARRRAARAEGWRARLEAFATEPLGRAAREALVAAATVRHPSSPPDQRALEALLEERATPLLEVLPGLESASRAVVAAPDHSRLIAWREWIAALGACFVAADRAWAGMAPLLRETGAWPAARNAAGTEGAA